MNFTKQDYGFIAAFAVIFSGMIISTAAFTAHLVATFVNH